MKMRSLFNKIIRFDNRGFWKVKDWDEVLREVIPMYKFVITYFFLKEDFKGEVILRRDDSLANDEFKIVHSEIDNTTKIVFGRHPYRNYIYTADTIKFQNASDDIWFKFNIDNQMETVLQQLNCWGNYRKKWENLIRGREYVYGLI